MIAAKMPSCNASIRFSCRLSLHNFERHAAPRMHLGCTRSALDAIKRVQLQKHTFRALAITIMRLCEIAPRMRHAAHTHHTWPRENFLVADVAIALQYPLGEPIFLLVVLAVKPDDENFVIAGGSTLYRSRNGFASPPNGVYLYVITAGEFTAQRKLVLMK